MRAAVAKGFVTFSSHFEGVVRTMYADILGLVTVAIGDLIDPIAAALTIAFIVIATGALATQEQIAAAWHAVKSDPLCAKYGWRYAAQLSGNNVQLTDEGVQEVVARKLAQNEVELKKRFPDWDEWPADGQLATHSMAWACGSGFRFPLLAAALNRQDFEEAARQCHIDTDGPDHLPNTGDDNNGVKPRNAANIILYKNAAKVQAYHLDPDQLFYPTELGDTPPDPVPTPDQLEPDSPVLHPIPDDLASLAQSRE